MPGLLPISVQDVMYSIQLAMSRKVEGTGNVHIFTVKGSRFAYDGASGALHRLDKTGYAVLDCIVREGIEISEGLALLHHHLSPEFSREDIRRAWEELCDLSGRTLFTEDPDLEIVQTDQVPGQGAKALCLNIAHDCNLACKYCFAGVGRFGGRPCLMSAGTARRALDFLIEASGSRRYLDVDFFGGEPLLAFEVVKDAILYARQKEKHTGKSFRFTLTTNCVLLSDEIISFLNDQNVSLILSLDGRPEVHDAMRTFRDKSPSHARVIAGALAAIRSRPDLDYFVRGTFTRSNLDFHEDVKYLYKAGFRRISLEPAVGQGDWAITSSDIPALRESYSELASFWAHCMDKGDGFEFYHFNLGMERGLCRERRTTGCGAGHEYMAVTPQGEIYPCHQLVGNPTYLLGHVASGVHRPGLQRSFAQARVPNKDLCRVCWARYLCGGGCHARAIETKGTAGDPDPLGCLVMKTRLEYALWAETFRLS